MSKFTLGPWRIVEGRTPTSLEVFAGKIAIAELWRRLDSRTEMANARLIAAAPDMYEFAQWILTLKTGGMIEGRARALIENVEKIDDATE